MIQGEISLENLNSWKIRTRSQFGGYLMLYDSSRGKIDRSPHTL